MLARIISLLRRISFSDTRGYSLWELGISTAVIGVLGTTMLGIMSQKKERERTQITHERIEMLQKTLDSFANTEGFLPCPALPFLSESDVNFGKSEKLTIANSVTQASNYNTATHTCTANGLTHAGSVPVRTLNIPDLYTYDGWGRKLTYRISDNAGSRRDYGLPTFRGTLRIIDTKGNEKTSLFEAAPNNDGATYVIVSHGANGAKAAWRKDSATAPTLTIDKSYEASNINHSQATYVQNERIKGFDDITAFGMYNKIRGVYAPFALPGGTCDNAASFSSVPLTSIDSKLYALSVSSGTYPALAQRAYFTAKTLKSLCDSRPPEDSDTTLSLWLKGFDPVPGTDTATGTLLPAWQDSSGALNHAAQGSFGLQPSYVSNAFTTRGGVRFNGSQYMDIPYRENLHRDSMTLFIVSKRSVLAPLGTHTLVSSRQVGVPAKGFYLSTSSLTQLNALVGMSDGNSLLARAPILLSNPHIVTLQCSPSEQRLYVNSTMLTRAINFTYTKAASAGALRIGQNFVGDIGEIRLYPTLLSDELRYKVEDELVRSWKVGSKTTTTR